MEKILIERPKEYQATTGETLEMHYSIMSLPLIDKWQRASILKKINSDSHFKVQSVDYINNDLIITVKVIDNPVPVAALVIAVSGVLGTFFIMNSLKSVYKIVEKPAGALLTTGTAIGVIAGIFALGGLLKRG